MPCYRIYENAEISAAYPALADAARIVGGWQIQSRASVGGNLCNSSPAGDTIPPLIALDARCVIVGPDGTARGSRPRSSAPRRAGTCSSAARSWRRSSSRPRAATSGSAYERFIPRNEMDIAVVGRRVVGAAERRRRRRSSEARVALAAVAPTPRFAAEASQWLAGKPATEETFAQAGELARKVASPISDMRGTAEFRMHLVGVLTRRTLAKAVERARG